MEGDERCQAGVGSATGVRVLSSRASAGLCTTGSASTARHKTSVFKSGPSRVRRVRVSGCCSKVRETAFTTRLSTSIDQAGHLPVCGCLKERRNRFEQAEEAPETRPKTDEVEETTKEGES